jgi:hypothetical protein
MKKIGIINKALIVLSIIVNTVYLVLDLIGNVDSNILACLSYYILAFIPVIFRKFKIKFSALLELVYLLFIILACLMGSIMKFYDMIYAAITENAEMQVKAEHAAKIISIIETAHAANPMPVKF